MSRRQRYKLNISTVEIKFTKAGWFRFTLHERSPQTIAFLVALTCIPYTTSRRVYLHALRNDTDNRSALKACRIQQGEVRCAIADKVTTKMHLDKTFQWDTPSATTHGSWKEWSSRGPVGLKGALKFFYRNRLDLYLFTRNNMLIEGLFEKTSSLVGVSFLKWHLTTSI